MFELIAIAALAVSGICAIGSTLWALKVYKGKHGRWPKQRFTEKLERLWWRQDLKPRKDRGLCTKSKHTS